MSTDSDRIDAYLARLERAGRASTTLTTYRYVLHSASRTLPHGMCATTDELAEWIAGHTARNTRSLYQVILTGFYRWCLRHDKITADPSAELDPTRPSRGVPRPLSAEQVATILTWSRRPERLWCLLMVRAGLRCIEVSRLDRGDVTAETMFVRGKGDRDRSIPTHPEVWAAVQPLPPGPIAGYNASAISARIAAECRRLGLRGVTAHRLRHTAASAWHQVTGDLRVTQELLGHASPATTAIYAQASSSAMRAAVMGATSAAAAPAG